MGMHGRFISYQVAAKGLALTASTFTSMLVLFSHQSLASTLANDSTVSELVNWSILILTIIGWADIIYTDMFGKQIIPSLGVRTRHMLCGKFYSVLGGAYLIRTFVALDASTGASWVLVTYYIFMSIFVGLVSLAITKEMR